MFLKKQLMQKNIAITLRDRALCRARKRKMLPGSGLDRTLRYCLKASVTVWHMHCHGRFSARQGRRYRMPSGEKEAGKGSKDNRKNINLPRISRGLP